MLRSILPVGAALLGASTVLADAPTCSLAQKCPESAPCCSQYGQCGVGAYCLGGCDPRMSYSLDSCTPEPVCQSKTFAMNSLNGIVDISDYLGDPSKADWVSQGEPAVYDGNVILTMPAESVGTVLASSTYMWYGTVTANLKTSRDAGVVTAFILLSDVKDEIDYEFVGTELSIAQTNYYFQGIPDYDNSANITGLSDTYENFHEYKIEWTPDQITWYVDGQPGRTKKKSDTWNATANQWNYPQTPARVQLSIWPGGASSNAPGTVSWAGGPIDWSSSDIQANGYYFATFGQIEMQCYNASSPPGTNTGVSYTFSDVRATNDTVIDGDKPTVLSSFSGTGLDMTAGASANSTANSIPGGNGNPGQDPNAGSNTGSSSNCQATGFSQNCGSSKNEGSRPAEKVLGASAFAVVIAVAGLLWL